MKNNKFLISLRDRIKFVISIERGFKKSCIQGDYDISILKSFLLDIELHLSTDSFSNNDDFILHKKIKSYLGF